MALTDATRRVNEGTTFVYKATLQDEDGNALTLASIATLTLTLTDLDSGSVINSRDAQDVKNANQVTIHATSGLLTWTALPADAVIVTAAIRAGVVEHHVALFEMTYSSDKKLNHVVDIFVAQLDNVS